MAISRIELASVGKLISINQIRSFALYNYGDDSEPAHRLSPVFLILKQHFAPARTLRAPAQGQKLWRDPLRF